MDAEEQENELLALHSIFGSEEFVRHESKSSGELRVSVELPSGYQLVLREGDTLKQFKISSLPAVHLTFELPEDYPSCSPPSFTLSCKWLTYKQLAAVGTHLDELYRGARGDVVLFSWIQFLREDTLTFLDITSALELPNEPSSPHSSQDGQKTTQNPTLGDFQMNEKTDSSNGDSSVTLDDDQTCIKGAQEPSEELGAFSGLPTSSAQDLLMEILIHDAAQGQKVFQSTPHDCAVCFLSYLGSQCVQIQECGHVFCRACLTEFCKLQITEGNVRGVTCAQVGCAASPTQAQVESLVGEEMFRRYDRLLLQSTLDSMADVTYCPRPSCASPVVVEEASRLAVCSVCGFSFCASCKKTYHGSDDCKPTWSQKSHQEVDPRESIAHLPRSLEGMKALWDDYASGSKERRRLLVSRYGRKDRLHSLEDLLSESWITSNSKNCPHCFCRIEKNLGCNLMTCSHCHHIFCWACLAILSFNNSYKHFQDNDCSKY